MMNVSCFNKPPIINFGDITSSSSSSSSSESGRSLAVTERRRRALKRVDSELQKRNFKAALSLVKVKHFPAFGIAGKVLINNTMPFDEVNVNGEWESSSSLESLVDVIVHSVKCSLMFQLLEEEEEAKEDLSQNLGEGEAADCESSNSLSEDHQMCVQHEAGHFLIGYLLGVLPMKYKVPSMEDLLKDEFASGNVEFIGFEFLRDVYVATISNKRFTRGKLNNKTLRTFSCVILGGLVAEHLSFGYSELLHSDVQQLDRVLKWLGFTDTEIDSEVRLAAKNAVMILCRHSEARLKLAEAMTMGRSIGFCIDAIERTLNLN